MSIPTPTVHLNGTSGQDLLDQYADAISAVQNAMAKIPAPHGRDYFSEFALTRARLKAQAWVDYLRFVEEELEEVAQSINLQVEYSKSKADRHRVLAKS